MKNGNITEFEKTVFETVKRIPLGRVSTYSQIALKIGNPNACRAVGNALHNNPTQIEIPCHRVLNFKGETAKCFVFGGKDMQRAWLEKEGIIFDDGKVDLKKYIWQE